MYRDLIVKRFYLVDGWNAGIRMRPLRGWQFEMQFAHQNSEAKFDYRYNPEGTTDSLRRATFAEIKLGFRFAPFEKLMRLSGRTLSQDKGAAVLWATITKGISGVMKSDYDYWKADVKLQGKFRIRSVGLEHWQFVGGWVSRPLPYLKMYSLRSNFDDLSVYSPGSFETVRPNEFLNQYYLAVHHRHNFGSWKTGINWIRPEFNWANNFGIGWLPNKAQHTGLTIQDMSMGFFETGLVIEDIIKVNIAGIGGGVFYRYGPYAFFDQFDNLVFKLSMKIGF
jgi:hypothetical protein